MHLPPVHYNSSSMSGMGGELRRKASHPPKNSKISMGLRKVLKQNRQRLSAYKGSVGAGVKPHMMAYVGNPTINELMQSNIQQQLGAKTGSLGSRETRRQIKQIIRAREQSL